MSRKIEGKQVSVTIRFPQELWDELSRMAHLGERSLNGEVVYLLRLAIANQTEVFATSRDS